MSTPEHTPLTEAEVNWLGWVVYEGAPSRDDMLGKLEAVARRIKADAYAAGLAARTSTATADTDALADWLGAMPESRNVFDLTDEATTVINIDVETLAQRIATRAATADTGLRERVERAERLIDAWEHDAPGLVDPTFIGRLRETLRRDPAPVRLRDATPASTEDRADNEGQP